MGEMKTYKDFADDDYQYFMFGYEHGQVANIMAAIAQGICEKYLKHVIEEYYQPNSREEMIKKEEVLHTHSLLRLKNFLEDYLDIKMNPVLSNHLRNLNGYYFSTRYPGDEAIAVRKEDMDVCADGIRACRAFVYEIIENNL